MNKIIQIIPATGWYAVYLMDDGIEDASALPCMALDANGNVFFLDEEFCEASQQNCSNFLRIEYRGK